MLKIKRLICIPITYAGLTFLTACGSMIPSTVEASQVVENAQVSDIKNEPVAEASGVTLAKAGKRRQSDDEKNFESAYDYANFEKRIMEISRLTEPED